MRGTRAFRELLSLPMLLVLGLGLLATIGGVAMLRDEPDLPDEEPARIPVVVQSPKVLSRPTYIVASGEVEAQYSADVGFSTGGVIALVGPEEGEFVRKGELLAQLDPTDYRLNVELATAAADAAEDQYARAKQMYQSNGLAPADYAKAEAGVRQARAQAGLARKRLSDTRLLAPLSGIVARRGVDPGEHVAPGMPVFSIVAMDPVQVRLGIPEAEISRIRTGQLAAVQLPSVPGSTFQGEVRLVGVAADPVSRTYQVKIAVPNPERVLRPGMIAEAQVQGTDLMQSLTIPGEAIIRNSDGSTHVYVYFPAEKRVHARRITVGSVRDKEVEVTSGLSSSDQVVVGGQHRIREGTLVDARVAAAPSTNGEVGR